MTEAITFRGVSVAIKKQLILQDITGNIKSGVITGLLGPSGAGKTTLIRCLLGLQPYQHGSIQVLGMPPGHRMLHTQIGYVSQSPSFYPDLTVLENLSYFGTLLRQSASEVAEVIELVDLIPQSGQLAGSLSGGQRARVSLAIALLGKPKLLVLDEPTVGLDPLLRQHLWQTFRQLTMQGTTIVISSHVMDEANKCDQLWFIRRGKLIGADTPTRILGQTRTTSLEEAFLQLSREDTKL